MLEEKTFRPTPGPATPISPQRVLWILQGLLAATVIGLGVVAATHPKPPVAEPSQATTKPAVANASPTASPSPSPTALLTFTSQLERSTLQYPSDWEHTSYSRYSLRGLQYEDQLLTKNITVSGKPSRIEILFRAINGDPGTSADECTRSCEVADVIPLDVDGYPKLNIIVGKVDGSYHGIAVTDRSDIAIGSHLSIDDLYFRSRTSVSGRVTLHLLYSSKLSESQYLQPEYSEIPLEIMQSLNATGAIYKAQ